MKVLLSIIVILLSSQAYGQLILSENKDEMAKLLNEHLELKNFRFQSLGDHYETDSITADSLMVEDFRIADLNHDGVNDLYAMGNVDESSRKHTKHVFIATVDGNSLRQTSIGNHFFTRHQAYQYPRIITHNQRDYLMVTYKIEDTYCQKKENVFQSDTLYVRDDYLVPKPNYVNEDFESLIIKGSSCFGTCPVFEMTINHSGKVKFKGLAYTNVRGRTSLKFDTKQIEFINDALKSIDFKNLKDYYAICASDNPTVNISVTFKDGSSYSIKDYGRAGTLSLRLFYNYIFDLLRKYELTKKA
ncbi:DUF6438 domain-containing protein [Ekhidna sp.]